MRECVFGQNIAFSWALSSGTNAGLWALGVMLRLLEFGSIGVSGDVKRQV